MTILDNSPEVVSYVSKDCYYVENDENIDMAFEDFSVLHECHLQVYLNEKLSMEIVCTPIMLPELLLGHLYSEGRIAHKEDITQIYICKDAAQARVFSKKPIDLPDVAFELHACNCSEAGILGRCDNTGLEPLPNFEFDSSWISLAAKEFQEDSPLYSITHGIHSCFLLHEGCVRYICEDIGRHNALDKAIGCVLRDDISLNECICLTSGRVPSDIMKKIIRSKIPVLLSNSVPTDLAVELARKYHVWLICRVNPQHWHVFSSPDFWKN